ncbi:Protein CBG26927 [Caenorhabditis briggsae]|uniref:Serpentine receptor class gamma n=2 Tax=Caenorhabditis briggsae TaxID=6238 RepID=B6IKX4_CAEBR|nr:Protein CBG26927 [Caenorhabditis briggsae]CAS00554.1 Protein CBG26927 [Caenorhabditis briggsae]
MEVLYLTYGVPSIILTLFFLIFLNRSEFKYSFYRIVQCDLIVNVFCFSECINFFYNLQSVSVIIMSIHRLSASEFIKANEFWTRRYLPIYSITVSTFVCFNLFVYLSDWTRPLRYDDLTKVFVSVSAEAVVTFLVEKCTFHLLQTKSALWSQIFYWMSLTYFSVILFTNILTIISIKTRYNKKSASEKTRRMMINLTLITSINSSIFFIVFIWQSIGKSIMELQTYMASMYVLSDSMTLLLPYMLLVFDSNVRKALAKAIGSKAVWLARSLGTDSSLLRTTSVINVIGTN